MSRPFSALRDLLVASGSLAVLAAVATPALAQTDAAGGDYQIEELIVTAEKREQSVQDVPVAISAYTSAQRDLMGITGVQDFVNFTPGMNYSGTDRISLRGAGRNTIYIGNDPGVATYTDGFYSASSSELFKSPLFVERTEVLRGPQGTLYGRNAIGGAVNTIAKRPGREFGGEIRALGANYDRTKIEGVVSLPVAESLRFLVGGSQDWQREGFIENIGPGNEAGTIKRTYFEFQAEAELGERVETWLRYSRTGWDDTFGIGDRMSNLTTPYDTTSLFAPIGLGSLFPNPLFGYTVPNPALSDPYVQNTDRDGYGQLRGNHLLTAQVTVDLGFADLKYIGGFQKYNYQTGGDNDASSRTGPIPIPGMAVPYFPDISVDFNEHKRYYSNEINLTSKGDGPLKWILGLYQYHEEHAQTVKIASPSNPQYAQPLTQTLTFAAPNPERNILDQLAEVEADAWAVFGQATYRLNDQFAVTAGLRYTKDEKDGYERQRLVALSPLIAGGAVTVDVSSDLSAAPGVQNFRSMSNSWDAVTGTLNLDWTPDEDTLVYAKYSRGYKAGGFLLGTLASQPEAKEETVDAYEIGLKKSFGGRLILNGAAFYNDYSDLQLNLTQLNALGTAAANNFVNVDAEAYGLELEALWQPIRNLQFSASYGYLHTEITRGCCFYDPADPSALLPSARPAGGSLVSSRVLLVFQDLKGSKLYQSPENKFAFNGNYTFDFSPGSLTVSGTYTWTDETTYQPFGNPAFRVPDVGTAEFRAIWNDAQDRYTLIGYVKNAFDEDGYTSTGSTNPGAVFGSPNPGLVVNGVTYLRQTGVASYRGLIAPRTYGVELQYRF